MTLARVTTWEGGTPEGLREAAERMKADVGQGPPPGVKSTGLTMLVDPEAGRMVMIGLFASDQDLRESEPALKEMSPGSGVGTKTATDIYEVAAEARQ